MMVPDTNMIAEVSLFVNGFTTASSLALKLSRFYEMIKSQISQQVRVKFARGFFFITSTGKKVTHVGHAMDAVFEGP